MKVNEFFSSEVGLRIQEEYGEDVVDGFLRNSGVELIEGFQEQWLVSLEQLEKEVESIKDNVISIFFDNEDDKEGFMDDFEDFASEEIESAINNKTEFNGIRNLLYMFEMQWYLINHYNKKGE